MEFKTKTRSIGTQQPCYIIAEAGVHHDGSLEKGFALIEAAKQAGADAIKFQTYKAETLVTTWAPRYWLEDDNAEAGTQFDTFKERDSFGLKEYEALASHSESLGIDFISTPFDNQAVDWLESIDIPFYKIASADHTNFPLLEKIAATGKAMVLSTGACHLEEIQNTVKFLRSLSVNNICLLHCVLSYPTADEDANLAKISQLKIDFPDCLIGYSDHTIPAINSKVALSSIALGSKIFEKHFTLDTNLPDDDHYHSFDAKMLTAFVRDVRSLEMILGSKDLVVLPCEEAARKNARRSLVASCDIQQGQKLSVENMTVKRPGTGVSAIHYNDFINKVINCDISKDQLITYESVN